MTALVLDPVRATFRAVATTVVPEAAALEAVGWAALESRVELALAKHSDKVRKQLVTFLHVIEWVPVAWHFSRFSRLGPDQRVAVLRRLERSPHLLLRRGFWGLRTLVLLGYYSQPEVQASLGYRANPLGWSARRRSGEHASQFPPITLEVPALPDEPPATPGA